MSDMTDWINERRNIHNATVEGTWGQDRIHHRPEGKEPHWCWEVNDQDGYPIVTELREDEDDAREIATFIVDAHNTLPNLLTAVEKVLELHQRDDALGICFECDRYYPCPTVRAVQSAIEGVSDE